MSEPKVRPEDLYASHTPRPVFPDNYYGYPDPTPPDIMDMPNGGRVVYNPNKPVTPEEAAAIWEEAEAIMADVRALRRNDV